MWDGLPGNRYDAGDMARRAKEIQTTLLVRAPEGAATVLYPMASMFRTGKSGLTFFVAPSPFSKNCNLFEPVGFERIRSSDVTRAAPTKGPTSPRNEVRT